MPRIVIVGGHGKVALLLAPILAARGDDVVALIRDPAQSADVAAAGAVPKVLSVEEASTEDLAGAFAGADAIVWTAGAGGKGGPGRTDAIDRAAAIRSMDAASRAGVRRYVMVSWVGSHGDDPLPANHPLRNYALAKLAADRHLVETDLEWTIVGPETLTLEGAERQDRRATPEWPRRLPLHLPRERRRGDGGRAGGACEHRQGHPLRGRVDADRASRRERAGGVLRPVLRVPVHAVELNKASPPSMNFNRSSRSFGPSGATGLLVRFDCLPQAFEAPRKVPAHGYVHVEEQAEESHRAGEFAVRPPFAGGLAAFFVENELDAAAIGERLDEH